MLSNDRLFEVVLKVIADIWSCFEVVVAILANWQILVSSGHPKK